jgi:hypothetical protein
LQAAGSNRAGRPYESPLSSSSPAASQPGIEPGPRPSQSRVRSSTLQGQTRRGETR